MIDLVALFREASVDLAASAVSGFPGSTDAEPEQQPFDEKRISGVSGVSGHQVCRGPDLEMEVGVTPMCASRRATGLSLDDPERPERPEKHVGTETYPSGSLFQKPEKEREAGKIAVLPSADGLALWWVALVRLDPKTDPCPGYRHGEWARVHTHILTFLDTFGAEAERLGWTGSRLFGVHPEIGVVRVDHCGALMLGVGGPAHAITATEIRFGHLTHRTKPYQPLGVPIWLFRC